MITVSKNSTIYVLCPAYIKTGGPELLHQLVYELNKQNKNAVITYFDYNKENNNYINEEYKKYVSSYKLVNEIVDKEENIIIFPETFCNTLDLYKHCKKVIWWLSVDNFLQNYGIISSFKTLGFVKFLKKLKSKKVCFANKKIYKADYHLCQSYYAIDFLKKKGINSIGYLSDYINDIYFEEKNVFSYKKENNVLYNPKKGFKFTKKIIANCPNFNFIPIQNMTNDQVRDLLLKSKVYIDFGNHPGKDRFPREAAICGCCVITGKRGAANFYEDVPILPEFKFDDNKKNVEKITKCIENCLINYEKRIEKFENYRDYIKSEKKKFADSVNEIFVKEI